MHGLGNDLRYVVRVLRRSPGFTLVAIVSLAIGIGANAAMFGVVRTLLLTPLPVHAPEELKLVTWTREGDFSISQNGSTSYRDPDTGASLRSNFSYPLYRALREAAPDADVFAFAFLRGVSIALGDEPAFLAGGALADGRYFSALRVPMAIGRPLTPADDVRDGPLVVVLSHRFWMRAFGGDPAVLGRTLRVNGVPAEVVGVTAEGFKGLSLGGFFPQTEITAPLSGQPRVYSRMSSDGSLFSDERVFWVRLMARVPAGAETSAERALAGVMRSTPSPLLGGDEYRPELRLIDGSQGAQPVNPDTARLLWFLMGVVGIVLLIACVNLASLMLARGVSRQREMAVRRALGGGRVRLMRQMLLEALVLAGAGTAAGLALTWVGREFLRGLLTGSLGAGAFGDLDMEVVLDPAVLGVSTALALVATLSFGLLPALRLSGLDPIAWLKQRGAGAAGTPRLTAGRLLIALQIAVSVPLVVGAVLFLRTVANLGSVELGFDPQGVVSFQVDPGFTTRPSEDYARLYQELLARIGEVPGVHSVTLVENAPLSGIVSNSSTEVDGRRVSLYRNAIGPDFARAMGVRLISGRMPGLQDGPDAPVVGVVNEKAVADIFGGASPIGRTLTAFGTEIQIIGVVNDMPYRNRRDPVPATIYPSALQVNGYGGHHIVLRTGVPLARLEPTLREAVARVDADVPVPTIREQTEIIAQTGAKERVFTQLLVIFGGFALLLASIGLHGVTSYSVTRRTSEIGVRVAVGARPQQILWMVLRQVVVLAGIGLAVGVPAALAAAPIVESLLYGVAPTSPGVVVGAAAVMLAVAMVAGLLPALRAAKLDALVALRSE